MKKIYLSIMALALSAVMLNSCKKEEKVAFTHATMKPWFDTYCKSCHGSGGTASGEWKYDSEDYEGSIKEHISHLNEHVAVVKDMPPNVPLSASELQKFIDWYGAGYPAN